MTAAPTIDERLRELAPRVLGVVARRSGNFADAEDAVQEALTAAAVQWPTDGVPDNPAGWLVRVANRRLVDARRRDEARRRREERIAVEPDAESAAGGDDTLTVMLMCCHPVLSAATAIPLTLRAVGGLTTKAIAAAFLVPEATMAQRISRAKATLGAEGIEFGLPGVEERPARVRAVLHVLYLLFNEGYATSAGPELARTDLSGEAIRLARLLHAAVPGEPEVTGLLALMLLDDARRPARIAADGALVPLAEQDRSRWDRALISEGLALITAALGAGAMGEYQIQAAIAGLHDQAVSAHDTNWAEILALYGLLERMTANPMVTLNRAVAAAMVHGPDAGLAMLVGLDARLGDHHRLHAVRAHLLVLANQPQAAAAEFRAAAGRAGNARERDYLITQAAHIAAGS